MAKKVKTTQTQRRRKKPEAAPKPVKLTRGHLTTREHKDMSTNELERRIEAKRSEAQGHGAEINRLSSELQVRRATVKVLNEDLQALEALVESRR